jgi:galactokinase
MTGAGFGGCIVALVKPDAVASYVEQVATQYRTETGLTPLVFVCTATDGAGVIG